MVRLGWGSVHSAPAHWRLAPLGLLPGRKCEGVSKGGCHLSGYEGTCLGTGTVGVCNQTAGTVSSQEASGCQAQELKFWVTDRNWVWVHGNKN